MSLTNSHLQHLYEGFLKTPLLWTSNSVLGLNQLHISHSKGLAFKRSLQRKLRLGQLAEQFVFNQLDGLSECTILIENVQVQKEKQTLGELDALIELDRKKIHLEIIYKFYLYDETLGASEIDRWIGPNRNDSLIEKIAKLKNKQLPLLYSSECKSILKEFNLNNKSFQQRVFFKAQLFIPYKKEVDFNQLNKACVHGFYIHIPQLNDFKNCLFYIPAKLEWFLDADMTADWLSIEAFKSEVDLFIKQSKSPLIWIKKPDNTLLKCFLVWW